MHNRRTLLRALLDALEAQSYENFEVIVVDDGSDDGTAEEAVAEAKDGRMVRVVRTEGVGAVAARRAGVSASSGELLAFTDSDCVPDPDWLAAGVRALEQGADVVSGRTVPAGPVGVLEHSVASGEEGLYPTCNVFYRRAAYESSGGFDPAAAERLGFRRGHRARRLGFGEDTLLAWRVRRKGRAGYAPDAVVHHQVLRLRPAELLSRTSMVGAFPALVREVPELRSTVLLRGRVSLGRRSRLPVYLLGSALLARRPVFAIPAAAWWTVSAGAELRRSGTPMNVCVRTLPVVLARDVVVATALVCGSVRARTVVL